MGGEIIEPRQAPMTQPGDFEPLNTAEEEHEKTNAQRGVRPVRVPSGFRLLEVCRQIYNETSTHVFEFNTFRFTAFIITKRSERGIIRVKSAPWYRWTSKLLPGQRNSVTDVELDTLAWIHYHLRSYRMRDSFPSLKRVHITTIAVAGLIKSLGPKGNGTNHDMEKYFSDLLCEREGKDVELVVDLVD